VIISRNSSEADSYYQLARAGQVFVATAALTGMTVYSTAAATGGPLLWNNTGVSAGTSKVLAIILGVSLGWTTAPGAAGVVGLTWGTGQTSAPTSTTTITGVGCTRPAANQTPACNVYNKGTVATAGATFLSTHEVDATATAGITGGLYEPLDGLIIASPGDWVSVAAGATISTMVADISLVWAELTFK
jgi:hypothetical protein